MDQWRQYTRCVGWEHWQGAAAAGEEAAEAVATAAAEAATGGQQRLGRDGRKRRASELEVEEPELLQWFWALMHSLTQQQLRALLRFWTALPLLPAGGFGALPRQLRLVRADHTSQRFPRVRQ